MTARDPTGIELAQAKQARKRVKQLATGGGANFD